MNLLTESMERLTKMLVNTDSKLKGMATLPYGTRKLSSSEQRKNYENLTQEQLMDMLEEHGVDSVNAWLSRFEEKEHG